MCKKAQQIDHFEVSSGKQIDQFNDRMSHYFFNSGIVDTQEFI